MNAIAKIGSTSVFDSSKILDAQEKVFFNQILQKEVFATSAQADALSESAQASLGACQTSLQGQASFFAIMTIAEQS